MRYKTADRKLPLVRLENHGSITLVRPLTGQAEALLKDNVQEDAQWWGDALVVEPRYVLDLVTGLKLVVVE